MWEHTATLARAESKDEIVKPFFKDATVDLLQKLGLEHEQRYLRELAQKDGLAVTQIDVNSGWDDAVAQTVRALREGVDAVYQATFLDGEWGGRSDFLVRVNTPSALGSWSYEVVETKLARSTKATALVQLCFYSDLLSRIQGVEPQWMHVVLGGTATPERFVCFRQACIIPVQKRLVIQGRSALSPRVFRKKEIHVISDAIAEVMADGAHTI